MKSVLCVLALLATAASAPAQSGAGCPNRRAHPIPPIDEAVPPLQSCRSHVLLFGIDVPIGASRCPTARIVADAHAECTGEWQLGTRCAPAGVIPVQLWTCACTEQSSGWFSVSRCRCESTGSMGFLPNAVTVSCP